MVDDTGPPGRVVGGRYTLTGELGRGGMGVVWRAVDELLDREVAVKEVTFPRYLSAHERAVLRERTLREARAAARLASPHVTAVYDVVEEDDRPWLVMECVDSRSLASVLREEGPVPAAQVARLGLDLLDALEAAHQAGIVHRDVKPANVLVDAHGRAHLTDFGIASAIGDSGLTTSGAILGSPAYMAPERASGGEPRPPVDLWSLGATLYAAVEGGSPFDRGEPMATMFAVVHEPVPPAPRAGPLEPVLRGLLTKDPAERWSAARAREQLRAVAEGGWTAPEQRTAPPDAPPDPQAGTPPDAPPRTPPGTPPRPRRPPGSRGSDVVRLDLAELRSLASASRAALGSVAGNVARETRQQVRTLADRNRQDAAPAPPPAPPRRRFRFKRRWVVVPLLVVLLVLAAVVTGVVWLLAHASGL